MECTPGDRVALVATNDPYTRLRPGDRGTITSVTDRPEPTIDIQWDNGSTLAILPDAGDRIRLLPSHDPDPPSSPAMPEDPTQPRYPEVQVQLSGEDGNAFAILGRTTAALRAAGVPSEEIDAYFAEATSGDYDHLLHTTMAWVNGVGMTAGTRWGPAARAMSAVRRALACRRPWLGGSTVIDVSRGVNVV